MRELQVHWNGSLVAASIVISFLGAFTSTQLVCQARLSRHLHAVILWTILASLSFGFCSIWCLHFVAMLAYELDVKIGLNVPVTVLSAFLAVFFTFVALASDLVWDTWKQNKRRIRKRKTRESRLGDYLQSAHYETESSESLMPTTLPTIEAEDDEPQSPSVSPQRLQPQKQIMVEVMDATPTFLRPIYQRQETEQDEDHETSSDYSFSRRQSDTTSETSSFGLGMLHSIKSVKRTGRRNPLIAMPLALWNGLTIRVMIKGFFWSIAITSMHYAGILALEVPEGGCTFHFGLVALSSIISWVVCTAGSILMASMETYLIQQILFAIIATLGVAAMHFTGMAAVQFWSNAEAQQNTGYPPALSVTIVCIATLTCLSANGLLVHSATLARNKLSEIIKTRKKLWAALAQKEHAEQSAQARSEWIASASHEIRTPLHQLVGYGDLLAREKLTDEGRLLLRAIQDATKTLSLITNNVLDWSRLEKGEAVNRPTVLNIRDLVDSVIGLLPTRTEENQVEILVSVSPDLPTSLYLDELSITRIVLNLLSNACKFTCYGYVLLMVSKSDEGLEIFVEDTGCGVPDSFLPELFQPFKQAQTRGAERGTGLGLSIVKQLLAKMSGDIHVESRYRDDPGIGIGRQGSKFTVTIPLAEELQLGEPHNLASKRLAIVADDNARLPTGLMQVWSRYNVEAETVQDLSATNKKFDYVWVNASRLTQDHQLRDRILGSSSHQVLIPYDNENSLYEVLGSKLPSHVIPIRRPLTWHRILENINNSHESELKEEIGRPSVRFADNVEIMNGNASPQIVQLEMPQRTDSGPITILLVEDNKLNQKLGVKMLKMCGYENVILAEDGQEAVDAVCERDEEIDLILMDQSMPRKDGLQATKEIRELEQQGKLKGSRRLRNAGCESKHIIIAVTAVVGPAHEATCKAVGTDAFLAKPLSFAKLKETLAVWLDSVLKSEQPGT